LSFEPAERKIRRMANGLTRLSSRLALIVCGMISLLLSRTFKLVQSAMPNANVKWSLFSTALMLMGGITVVIALFPSSWLDRVCKIGADTRDGSFVPIKLLGGFAAFSYLLTVGLDLSSLSWHSTAQVAYLLCPACVLTVTVDPSFGTVLLALAPLNAAVYGSLGAVLGCALLAVRNRLE
jgi:hypothetical protein